MQLLTKLKTFFFGVVSVWSPFEPPSSFSELFVGLLVAFPVWFSSFSSFHSVCLISVDDDNNWQHLAIGVAALLWQMEGKHTKAAEEGEGGKGNRKHSARSTSKASLGVSTASAAAAAFINYNSLPIN